MHDPAPPSNGRSNPPASRGRPWYPWIILSLASALVLYVRLQPELERNLKGWATTAILLLGTLLLLPWFLLSSRFPARIRLALALGLGLFLALAAATLRFDGAIDGTGLPRITTRWARTDPQLASTPATRTSSPGNNISSNTTANHPAAPVNSLEQPRNPDHRPARSRPIPGFFGTNRTGSVPDPGLATDWHSNPPREIWRRPIGLGWSSFAVLEHRALTQDQEGTGERVVCLDLLTGDPLWVHSDQTRFNEWQGGDGPRATPSIHKDRVLTLGATGFLNCLDLTNGTRIWQRRILTEFDLGTNEWATASSPLVVDDTVIVGGGRGPGPALLAFQLQSGTPLWQAGNDSASYASPILATLAGRRLILASNARSLIGADPTTGRILLEHTWGSPKWPKASQPVVVGTNRIFLSAGYGVGCQMIQVQPSTNDTLQAAIVWKGLSLKTQFNSVALLDGHLYGLDDGLLACVRAEDGKRLWKDGRYGSGQTLLAGNLILVQAERGPIHLATASPDSFRELATFPALDSKTWNHPTLAGRFLLVRNDRQAACFELPLR